MESYYIIIPMITISYLQSFTVKQKSLSFLIRRNLHFHPIRVFKIDGIIPLTAGIGVAVFAENRYLSGP